MFPVFFDLNHKEVFIVGESKKAFQIARYLLDKCKTVNFFSREPIQDSIKLEEDITACTFWSMKEKKECIKSFRNSSLLILESDDYDLNQSFTRMAQSPYNYSSRMVIVSSKDLPGIDARIGDEIETPDYSVGVFSKYFNSEVMELVEEYLNECLDKEKLHLLSEINDLIKELNENSNLAIDYWSEKADLIKEYERLQKAIESRDRTIRIGIIDRVRSKTEALVVSESLKKRGYNVETIIFDDNIPFDPTDREYFEGRLSNKETLIHALKNNEIDILIRDSIHGKLEETDGLYEASGIFFLRPLSTYLITKEKIENPWDIKKDTKIYATNSDVIEQLDWLYAEEFKKNNIDDIKDNIIDLDEYLFDFLDTVKENEDIALTATDYELFMEGIDKEYVLEQGLNLIELEVVPYSHHGRITAYCRETDSRTKKILDSLIHEEIRKVVQDEDFLVSFFSRIFGPENSTNGNLFCFFNYDPERGMSQLNMVGVTKNGTVIKQKFPYLDVNFDYVDAMKKMEGWVTSQLSWINGGNMRTWHEFNKNISFNSAEEYLSDFHNKLKEIEDNKEE